MEESPSRDLPYFPSLPQFNTRLPITRKKSKTVKGNTECDNKKTRKFRGYNADEKASNHQQAAFIRNYRSTLNIFCLLLSFHLVC